jgi:hypothetical protein
MPSFKLLLLIFSDFSSGGIKLAELLCAMERRNEATGAHSEAVRR